MLKKGAADARKVKNIDFKKNRLPEMRGGFSVYGNDWR